MLWPLKLSLYNTRQSFIITSNCPRSWRLDLMKCLFQKVWQNPLSNANKKMITTTVNLPEATSAGGREIWSNISSSISNGPQREVLGEYCSLAGKYGKWDSYLQWMYRFLTITVTWDEMMAEADTDVEREPQPHVGGKMDKISNCGSTPKVTA